MSTCLSVVVVLGAEHRFLLVLKLQHTRFPNATHVLRMRNQQKPIIRVKYNHNRKTRARTGDVVSQKTGSHLHQCHLCEKFVFLVYFWFSQCFRMVLGQGHWANWFYLVFPWFCYGSYIVPRSSSHFHPLAQLGRSPRVTPTVAFSCICFCVCVSASLVCVMHCFILSVCVCVCGEPIGSSQCVCALFMRVSVVSRPAHHCV